MTDLVLSDADLRAMVMREDGQAVTTSLRVAEYFGKQHAKVLRAVRQLTSSAKFRQANFGDSSYLNDQGRKQTMVTMTKDGLTFLVMGVYRRKGFSMEGGVHRCV